MVTVVALEPCDRCRCRSQNAYVFFTLPLEPAPENTGVVHCLVEFVAADQHVRKGCEWRIVHPAAESQFLVVEAGEVVRGGELHGVVLGKVGLQDDFAGRCSAAGTTCDLGQKLESAFGG